MPRRMTAVVIASMVPSGMECDSLDSVREQDSCSAVGGDEMRGKNQHANLARTRPVQKLFI